MARPGYRRRFRRRYSSHAGTLLTGYGYPEQHDREVTFDLVRRANQRRFCTACGGELYRRHLADRNGMTTRLHLACGEPVGADVDDQARPE